MTLIFKKYTGGVRDHSLAEDEDKLARACDDICCKGPANSFRWWGSRLVRIAAQQWHPSEIRDCLVQIEGKQIAFDNHLQLVTGRVTELNVESTRKAIQSHGTIMQSLDGDKGS